MARPILDPEVPMTAHPPAAARLVPLVLLLALFAFLVAPPAGAEIRPSFRLDLVAWEATHVVVATEEPEIDGELTVLESWRGDLAVGETLVLPELAAFRDRESRTVRMSIFSFLGGLDGDAPEVPFVTGARMVLFLVRTGGEASAPAWEPASRDGFGGEDLRFSVAWIEQGRAFAFVQHVNPGPSELIHLRWTEEEMLDRVLERSETRAELADVLATPDRLVRALRLRDLAVSPVFEVRRHALSELGACGPPAVPVLLELAYDPALAGSYRDVVDALAEAGAPEATGALIEIVRRDTELWLEDAPGLAPGWWNGSTAPETTALKERYSRTLTAVWILERDRIESPEAHRAVAALRELWRAFPGLGEELTQLAEHCDHYLDLAERPER